MKYETTTNPVSAKFVGTKKELDSILVVGKDFDLRFIDKDSKTCPTCERVFKSKDNVDNIEDYGECLSCETIRGDFNQEQYDIREDD